MSTYDPNTIYKGNVPRHSTRGQKTAKPLTTETFNPRGVAAANVGGSKAGSHRRGSK